MWKIFEAGVKEALKFFMRPKPSVVAKGAKKVMEAAAKSAGKKV